MHGAPVHALCQDEPARLVALRTRYARQHSLMNIAPLELAIRKYPRVVCGSTSMHWLYDHRKDGPGWICVVSAPQTAIYDDCSAAFDRLNRDV